MKKYVEEAATRVRGASEGQVKVTLQGASEGRAAVRCFGMNTPE